MRALRSDVWLCSFVCFLAFARSSPCPPPFPTSPLWCASNILLQIVWFVFSIFFWGLVAYASTRFLQYFVFVSAGVITMRIRIMQRLLMDRFNVFLATKSMVVEERHYDEKNTTVLFTWEETLAAKGE